MGTIPGAMAFLQPKPVLQISTGATANTQGQFAYALSGIDPKQVYERRRQVDGARCTQYPGISCSSTRTFINHTPNLQIDILRDQAKLYGVSETRILNSAAQRLLAELHLPDQEADDQYQVILEVKDIRSLASPQDLEHAVHQERTTASAWFR